MKKELFDQLPNRERTPLEVSEGRDFADFLLATLSADELQLLYERYVEERGLREMGEDRGLSKSTVDRRVNGLVSLLRTKLGIQIRRPSRRRTPIIGGGVVAI